MSATKVKTKVATGRKYVIQYWNTDRDKVLSEALNAVKWIDSYRSPHVDRAPYEEDNGWAIDIVYYGL